MNLGQDILRTLHEALLGESGAGNTGLGPGLALYERGDAKAALAALERELAVSGGSSRLLAFVGLLHQEAGNVARSRQRLRQAAEAAPDDPALAALLGQCLYTQRDFSGAVRHLERALELAPDDPETLNDLGVACYAAGETARAEELLERAVVLDPGSAGTALNLGYVLLATGKAERALAAAERLSGHEGGEGAKALLRAVAEAGAVPGKDTVLSLSGQMRRIAPMDIIDFDDAQRRERRPVGLSVVVPVYNEAGNIEPLFGEILATLEGLGQSFEILFVDDGSRDGTDRALEALAKRDKRVRVIQFRRNYGQTAALAAGFKYCRGEIVVTLDGDMQNDPADIPRLLEKMAEGYDLVNGWRKNRQDKALTRRLPSWAANRLINKLIEGTGVQLHDFGCTLKAYKKGIIKNIYLYGEMHRFIPVFAAWLGVEVAEIAVNHRPRAYGVAKYGLSRVWRVIFDLIVVRFFSDNMTRPIQFFGKLAKKSSMVGFGIIAALWGLKLYPGLPVSYDALLILFALVCISALQIVTLGLTGELLLRSYFESQDKDHYVVKRILGG